MYWLYFNFLKPSLLTTDTSNVSNVGNSLNRTCWCTLQNSDLQPNRKKLEVIVGSTKNSDHICTEKNWKFCTLCVTKMVDVYQIPKWYVGALSMKNLTTTLSIIVVKVKPMLTHFPELTFIQISGRTFLA